MNISLLGPPGAGKGTIGRMLQQKLGIRSVSVGQKIREEIRKGTEIGKATQKNIEEGRLAPDKAIMSILRKIREENEEAILDGFPRSIAQIGVMENLGMEVDHVIYLKIDEKIALERIANRWTCSKCQEIYNVKTMPPKIEGRCDLCGEELYQREDQTYEALKERINVYHQQTLPVKEYYEGQNKLITVDASKPPHKVLNEILEKLGIL